MPTLLLELQGNMSLNRTIWPPRIFLYDDLVSYKKRKFFRVKEQTVPYSHVAQVNINTGLIFANVEIVASSGESLVCNYVTKKEAIRAKKIIDAKLYSALAKHTTEPTTNPEIGDAYERSLHRLKELLNRHKISKREYDQRKADLLKKLR